VLLQITRWWSLPALHSRLLLFIPAGILACLDGYMNIAMEQTEVCLQTVAAMFKTWLAPAIDPQQQ
jgi:hypothetical protein